MYYTGTDQRLTTDLIDRRWDIRDIFRASSLDGFVDVGIYCKTLAGHQLTL